MISLECTKQDLLVMTSQFRFPCSLWTDITTVCVVDLAKCEPKSCAHEYNDVVRSRLDPACISLQKHLGYFNHIFRLSELHQCDQEMLLGRFSWKSIEELFFSLSLVAEDLYLIILLTIAMQPRNSQYKQMCKIKATTNFTKNAVY